MELARDVWLRLDGHEVMDGDAANALTVGDADWRQDEGVVPGGNGAGQVDGLTRWRTCLSGINDVCAEPTEYRSFDGMWMAPIWPT